MVVLIYFILFSGKRLLISNPDNFNKYHRTCDCQKCPTKGPNGELIYPSQESLSLLSHEMEYIGELKWIIMKIENET